MRHLISSSYTQLFVLVDSIGLSFQPSASIVIYCFLALHETKSFLNLYIATFYVRNFRLNKGGKNFMPKMQVKWSLLGFFTDEEEIVSKIATHKKYHQLIYEVMC